MSANNTTKKRKVDSDESGISLAAILAEMQEMKSKLSHVDELESRCISMQNEMDGTRARMDELKTKYQQQEEKCNILEDRCDSLQRSIQILSKESAWKYSAPSIPGSHWTGLGFGGNYVESMEELVDEMKNEVIQMRNGKHIEYISFGEVSPEGDAGTLLQHDAALLPHWKEFTTALQLYHDSSIQFTLQNVQLTTSVMDLLIPALKGRLKMLFLDNNDLVDIHEGIEFIVTCIQSNHQMKEFYLSNNQLGNTKNVTTLLDAVSSHPSIDKVRLENCLGGDMNGYDVLCYLLASDRRYLEIDFDRNNIQTNGHTTIPDYIASNPPLKNLFLSGNKLNDNDARLIAKALIHNTNLQILYLYDNVMTDSGYRALSKAVYDPTSLNTVYDCNHTCQIEVDGDRISKDIPFACNNAGYTNPNTRRSMKIHYILTLRHKEGSNVQHLNTEFDEDKDGDEYHTFLTLKIVPKLFKAVYNHSNAGPSSMAHMLDHSLSIMYEILRGWKMPELYYTKRQAEGTK